MKGILEINRNGLDYKLVPDTEDKLYASKCGKFWFYFSYEQKKPNGGFDTKIKDKATTGCDVDGKKKNIRFTKDGKLLNFKPDFCVLKAYTDEKLWTKFISYNDNNPDNFKLDNLEFTDVDERFVYEHRQEIEVEGEVFRVSGKSRNFIAVSKDGRLYKVPKSYINRGVVCVARGGYINIKSGNQNVSINSCGKRYNFLIKELVADTWLDKEEGKTRVLHIDGDDRNYHYKNLMYVNDNSKLNIDRNVRLIEERRRIVVVYPDGSEEMFGSLSEASAYTDISTDMIEYSIANNVKIGLTEFIEIFLGRVSEVRR